MQLLQIIYNNRGPKTAVGSALDGIVKLNGIRRKSAGYSTCVVLLSGEVGTAITNGVVEDLSGNKWHLPDAVTITESPYQITVQCADLGAIEAQPNTITNIVTPTKGWLSVTNEVPAVPGAPIEIDAELRMRQSGSVALPSQTLLNGIAGGIGSLQEVSRCKVYENDTDATDENGIPSHSIAAVVEGGLEADIAEQIYLRKGPGCGTYGDVAVQYVNVDGLITNIHFFRPEYVTVNISITVKRRPGYTADVKPKIQELIKTYLLGLDIGTGVTLTALYTTVLSLITNLSVPIFSPIELLVGREGESMGTTDMILAFNQLALAGTITVVEV